MSEFKTISRTKLPPRNPSGRRRGDGLLTAIRATAQTGDAVIRPVLADDTARAMQQRSSALSTNLRADGLRVITQIAPDRKSVYVWAEKAS